MIIRIVRTSLSCGAVAKREDIRQSERLYGWSRLSIDHRSGETTDEFDKRKEYEVKKWLLQRVFPLLIAETATNSIVTELNKPKEAAENPRRGKKSNSLFGKIIRGLRRIFHC